MRREPVAPGEVRGWIITVQDGVDSTTGRRGCTPMVVPWWLPSMRLAHDTKAS